MAYMKRIDVAKALLKVMEETAERDHLGNIVQPVAGWCERLRRDIAAASRWLKESKDDDPTASS